MGGTPSSFRSGPCYSPPPSGADSPAFTGTPTAPTAGFGTRTNQLATTAFVAAAVAAASSSANSIASGINGNARVDSNGNLQIKDVTTGNYLYPVFVGQPGAETLVAVDSFAGGHNWVKDPEGNLQIYNVTTQQMRYVVFTGAEGAETVAAVDSLN